MERKALSKKLRFEVFKRDKFTCQYCGKKSPDVILQVDHIDPVALGGSNEILNLITSCQECNAGKKAIPLDKDVVLDKQRKQLEELQERREQIEMMFEWKKSLDNLGQHSAELLIEYIENNIHPYTLSETGKKKIETLVKKFSFDEIFAAIDKGKTVYLRYDDGVLSQDSVNAFVNKIGGIIINSKKSPIENKIHYIKGICRNRFHYWNDGVGISILKKYVAALREKNWSDEDILNDLETEASEVAKNAKNWPEWQSRMEGWIEDINSWEKNDNDVQDVKTPISIKEIETEAESKAKDVLMFFSLIKHLSIPFCVNDDKELLLDFLNGINAYLSDQTKAFRGEYKIEEMILSIDDLSPDPSTAKYISGFRNSSNIDNDLKFYIDDLCFWYFPHWMNNLYFPSMGIYNEKDAILFKTYYEKYLKKEIKQLQENMKNVQKSN